MLKMPVLDQSRASMSHIRHYRVLSWPARPLTSLESIVKYQTSKLLKRANRLSSDFFLSSFLHHDSTTMAEGFTTIQTLKQKQHKSLGITPTTYCYHGTQTILQ